MPDSYNALLGGRLVAAGFVSQERVDECLRILAVLEKEGLQVPLKTLLVEKGYITEEQLVQAEEETVVAMREEEKNQEYAPHDLPVALADKEEEGDEFVGRVYGRYEITGPIGRGGMGAVYLARNQQSGHAVALKILPGSLAATHGLRLQRFVREAHAASRLRQKNIVRILEVGRSAQDYFIAMEYVKGCSLSEYIRSVKQVPLDKALEIARQICQGLKEAEAQGIVHRDLKPSNILLGTQGEIKITDFGLAKDLADADITHTGQIIGTPHFMSPEQCDGQPVDTRADIYSLGATLYFMLTKRFPHVGETSLAVLLKHKTEELASPKRFRPNLPDPVCAVIRKMMAKSLSERYQTVAELEADLDLIAKGRPPKIADLMPEEQERIEAILRITEGPLAGKSFGIGEDDIVTLGRDAEKSYIAIPDKLISRIHCVIRHDGVRFSVMDIGSVNGTYVNGRRVQTHVLKPNDVITLGQSRLVFQKATRSRDVLLLAKVVLDMGLVSKEVLSECLRLLNRLNEAGQQKCFAELLREKRYLTAEQAEEACRRLDQRLKLALEKDSDIVLRRRRSPQREGARDNRAADERGVPVKLGLFEELRFCEQCGQYLSEADIDSGRVRVAGPHYFCANCIEATPLLGERIGTYALWGQLGRGRLGVVHKAEATATGRIVALKVFDDVLVSQTERVDHLLIESRRAAVLRNPGLVAISPISTFGGKVVLPMDLAGERNVRDSLLHRTPSGFRLRSLFNVDEALGIIVQVAIALDFAHHRHIVHGEVAPQKIILGGRREARLADTGMPTAPHLRALQHDIDTRLLEVDDCRAPELAEELVATDPRSDIFSLGLTFKVMITGRLPGQAPLPHGAAIRPPQEEPTSVEVPDAVQDVIAKMTDQDPSQRYPSMAAVLTDLRRIQKDRGTGA